MTTALDDFTIDELNLIGGSLQDAAPRAGLQDWESYQEWVEAEIVIELAGKFIGAVYERRYVRDCYLDIADEYADAMENE